MKTNKSIVISGVSSGIGKYLVECFLKDGWTVYGGLRNSLERAEVFKDLKQQYKENLYLLELDVNQNSSVVEFCKNIREHSSSGIDVLVNNAGYAVMGAFEDLSESDLLEQYNTNVLGVLRLTQNILPLLRMKSGRIFMMSSAMGQDATPLSGAYSSSKFALEGLSEALSFELDKSVKVCIIEPGAFRTNFVSNQKWAHGAQQKSSNYTNMTRPFLAMLEKKLQGKGVSAQKVAVFVLKLAHSKHLKFRYRVGVDSKMLGLMRILPANLRHRIMNALYRIVFKKLQKKYLPISNEQQLA